MADAPLHDRPPTTIRPHDSLQDKSNATADEAAEHEAFHRLLAAPSRGPTRVAPARQLLTAVRRSNRVSFLLWSAFGETRNFVVSPYSIRAALGFLYLGSDGKSRSRLQSRLAYPARPEDLDLRALDEAVRAEAAGRLQSASSLWVAEGDRLQPSYAQAAANYLPGELHAVGLHSEPDRARRLINAWASERSGGELIEPFSESVITAHVDGALVSTASFSGTWPSGFFEEGVGSHAFHPFPWPDDYIAVEMMYSGSCRAVFRRSVQAAVANYPGTSLSLMVVKPRSWKAFAWNEAVFAGLWDALSRAGNAELDLPTFKLSSVRDLEPPLKRMGVLASDRSLSFLRSKVDAKAPSVGRITHQAFIQVDAMPIGLREFHEEMRIKEKQFRPQEPRLAVDGAFYFLVVNKNTGLILFMGQVTDPTAAE